MSIKTTVSPYDVYDVAGNDFTKQFYKPPRVASFEYSENSLPVGVDLKGNILTVNLRNAARIIIMGTTGCLSYSIKPKGYTKDLRELKSYAKIKTLSYDFKNEKIVESESVFIKSGFKQTYGISFLNKKIWIRATKEHKFFVYKNKKIIEKTLFELKKNDKLFGHNEVFIIDDVFIFSLGEDTYDINTPIYGNFFLSNGVLVHNSGKTFKLRGMTDRRHKLNYCVVNLTDVKNEMGSSNKPVQEKFVKYLLEGEEPCRTPVVVLRPTFYKAISEELPKHNHWFSPLFSDMEKIDFMTMMGLDDKSISQAQKDAGEALFNRMKLEPKKYKTYDDLASLIDSIDELTQKQKDRFKLSVKNMFDSKFFMTGDGIIHDPIALSSDDLVVSFNHEGFDMFAKTGKGYPQVLVSMMIRKYTRARIAWVNGEKGAVKINRLFFDCDEGNSFFPANKEPSSKVEAIDSVKKDRRYGIYFNFAYQAWVDIPMDIVSQSRYCFLPHNVDLVDMQQAFENFTTMRVTSERKNRLREIQKQCRNIPHSWIMLDRETGVHTIFIPLPPMSYHMEMSK